MLIRYYAILGQLAPYFTRHIPKVFEGVDADLLPQMELYDTETFDTRTVILRSTHAHGKNEELALADFSAEQTRLARDELEVL